MSKQVTIEADDPFFGGRELSKVALSYPFPGGAASEHIDRILNDFPLLHIKPPVDGTIGCQNSTIKDKSTYQHSETIYYQDIARLYKEEFIVS